MPFVCVRSFAGARSVVGLGRLPFGPMHRGAASEEMPCCTLGTDKQVQPQGRQVRLWSRLPRSLGYWLPRLPLDLGSIRPSNPRHGPRTARSRTLQVQPACRCSTIHRMACCSFGSHSCDSCGTPEPAYQAITTGVGVKPPPLDQWPLQNGLRRMRIGGIGGVAISCNRERGHIK
jgi:hypothetical protein